MEALLDIRELASRLGVSVDWIRVRVKNGQIPKVPNMGRLIRFHPKAVERIFLHDPSSLKSKVKRAGRLERLNKGGARWQP